MFQSFIYLEVRVLLSSVPGVFISTTEDSAKKDILSVKADFLRKNNSAPKINSVKIEPSTLHRVRTLVEALGGTMTGSSTLERLLGNIQEPPDDRNFTGFSVRAAQGGGLDIMFHQKSKHIKIEEVRVEEDSGHLTRVGGAKPRMDWTYAGCPSIRIRTSSAFELGEEAELFLQELYTLLAYLKVVNPELSEAAVRCNAYVSMAEYPQKPSYTVKLRNLNSFNFVRKAINSELSRQEEILSGGGTVASESRLWIEERGTTESFQERQPCMERFAVVEPSVEVHTGTCSQSGSLDVELPGARRERLRVQYGLSRLRSMFICAEKDRADYFEQAAACGADPLNIAHWMAGELMRLLNRSRRSIRTCALTPQKFADVIKMFESGRINSGMAKKLLKDVFETGEDPLEAAERDGMTLLSEKELKPVVKKVLSENEKSVVALRQGQMPPLEYLTGCVMKKTYGRADAQTVKAMIKSILDINVIYVLAMGGAISARKRPDGSVEAGNSEEIRTLFDEKNNSFPVQISSVGAMLSEETEPADWARLIAAIHEKIESGTANGIVVTHGTDTLSYTAALLFWLFGASKVPLVITTSETLPSESDEAKINVNLAVKTAREKKNGVYVVCGGKIYSPLNLKFLGKKGRPFENWNLPQPIFTSDEPLSHQFLSVSLPEKEAMSAILNEAASSLEIVRLYPGMKASRLEEMFSGAAESQKISGVIMELYASGTGNMRSTDYSLKYLLVKGKKCGCSFYCTSQQERRLDFSEYATGAQVWREGAVPMGALTTESVTALYFAASLVADTREEFSELMETSGETLQLR